MLKVIGFHQIWIVEHNEQYGNNTFQKWASLTYKSKHGAPDLN